MRVEAYFSLDGANDPVLERRVIKKGKTWVHKEGGRAAAAPREGGRPGGVG